MGSEIVDTPPNGHVVVRPPTRVVPDEPDRPSAPSRDSVAELRLVRDDFVRFTMQYKFAIDEIMTKVSILREEFVQTHAYNPIEHVSSRLKSPESLVDKILRKGCEPTLESVRATITDIAGVRITCSFITDTYRVFDMLTSQSDLSLLQVKDYIKEPKPNGYQSLHAIVEVPVFLSTGPRPVVVELQVRTIAMDFWASLEHKIYYKYSDDVPEQLVLQLKEAAEAASALDTTMEQLHLEVQDLGQRQAGSLAGLADRADGTTDREVLEQLERFRALFGTN